MKKQVGENLSKIFYDCGKVSFTLFITGAIAKKPIIHGELIFGLIMTLSLVFIGVIISLKIDLG